MNLKLTGHVAIVQGASKGLGRGVAEALAAEGCDLIITARSAEPLTEASKAIAQRTGRRVVPYAMDSADVDALPALLARVEAEFGRLDVLVCNSGGPPAGGLLDLTPTQWADATRLVLTAPALLLAAALPLLKASPAPRFFVITSTSTRVPIAGLTLSNTLRPALVGLIKSLVEEFGSTGLCCHSIAPGRFETDRLAHLISVQAQKAGKPESEIKSAMLASIPAGRFGDPIELGQLVAYLSSPAASYLNGGNWMVDGGLVKAV